MVILSATSVCFVLNALVESEEAEAAADTQVVAVQKLAMSFVPVSPRFYTFGEVDSDHVHEHQ